MKKPRYVDKLHYYENAPSKDSETEAISMDRMSEETFYQPFFNKHLVVQAKAFFNCETIQSPYVCQGSSLCGWDNMVRSCFYNSQPSLHQLRFKEKKVHRK